MSILQRADYPENYTLDSNWVKVLPEDGQPLVAQDLLEMQSIVQGQFQTGMDTLYRDGTILSGVELVVVGDDGTTMDILITEGRVYAAGVVVKTKPTRFQVSREGETTFYLEVTTTVLEDESMRAGNQYGPRGASRLVVNSSIVLTGRGYPLYSIRNGVAINRARDLPGGIEETLAERVFERHGNFCVRGLDLALLDRPRTLADTSLVALNDNYSTLEARATESRNLYLESKSRLDGLLLRLDDARDISSVSPTPANLTILADLETRVEKEEALVATLEATYRERQTAARSGLAELEEARRRSESSLGMSLAPGVAYVVGRRVVIDTPINLALQRTTDSQVVTAATFTYAGITAIANRTISLQGTSTWANVLAQGTQVSISFAPINNSTITVTANTSAATSVETFIDYIITRIATGTDSNSTITGTNITTDAARNLLRDAIAFRRNGPTLVMESIGIGTTSNLVNITIGITITGGGPSSRLGVDVPSGPIGGAASTNEFKLTRRPVKEVTRLVATLQQNTTAIVRGPTPGTSDYLGRDTVSSVKRVFQGSINYAEGRDFQVLDGGRLEWAPNGPGALEPAPGTTYFVMYTYSSQLTLGVDYNLLTATDTIVFTGTRSPAPNTTFQVDYSYFLSRIAIVTLDKEGQPVVIYGEVGVNPQPPAVSGSVLPLARVFISNNSAIIEPIDCRPVNYDSIRQLASAVSSLSDDIDRLRLTTRAEGLAFTNTGAVPNFTSIDALVSSSGINLTESTGMLSPLTNSLTSNRVYSDVRATAPSARPNNAGDPYIVVPTYTESIFLEQTKLTKERSIQQTTAPRLFCRRVIMANRDLGRINPCDELAVRGAALFGSTSNPLYRFINEGNRAEFTRLSRRVREAISAGEAIPSIGANLMGSEEIDKARAQNIRYTIRGEGLPQASYQLLIADTLMTTAVPINNTPISGTLPFAFRPRSNGILEVELFLPALPPGVHAVVLQSDTLSVSNTISIFNNNLTHVALGGAASWGLPSSSIDTQPLPLMPRVGFDPLMQTFQAPSDMYLSSLEIRIASAPASGALVISLRDGTATTPGQILLGEALVNGAVLPDIQGRLWTKYVFPTPIYLKEDQYYTLGFRSTEGDWSVFTSEIGEADILNAGLLIGQQLGINGNIWSSDGTTISNHEREDISMRLYRAVFPTTPISIDLGSYSYSMTAFALNVRDIVPAGCTIDYQYKAGVNTNWISIAPNTPVCLDRVESILLLRAVSTGTAALAPIIEIGTVSLYRNLSPTQHISNWQPILQTSTKFTVAITALMPPSSTLEVRIQFSTGGWHVLSNPTTVILDAGLGLSRLTYEYVSPGPRSGELKWSIEAFGISTTDVPSIMEVVVYGTN